MAKKIFTVFLTVVMVSCLFAQDKSVQITIHPRNVIGKIDKKIYGQFLEHIYHSVSNGVWGENVWNRSFEEWLTYGDWEIKSNGEMHANALQSLADFNPGSGKNYEVTLDVKSTEGKGTILLGVRDQRRGRMLTNHLYCFFDAGKNGYHKLETATGWVWYAPFSNVNVTDSAQGTFDAGKWYSLRVRCDSNRITAWIGTNKVFDREVKNGPLNGMVTIGAIGCKAEFRNLKIISLDKNTISRNTTPVRHWQMVGTGSITAVTKNVLNHQTALKICSDTSFAGLEQVQNFNVKVKDLLKGSVYLKGDVSKVEVQLLNGNKIISGNEFIISSNWKEYLVQLPAVADCPQATLRISTKEKGNLFVDQVSLQHQSSLDNGGFRPELTNAAAALKPAIIRWPGGSFVELYNFEKGTGKQVEREGKAGWDDFDPYSFGTDEYIQFCRKVGAEPQIVVPIGYHNYDGYAPDRNGKTDWLQKALNWLEYCNGDKNTPWGAKRAANGHPEPYAVRYWEIDNEVWKMDPKLYAQLVRIYSIAMKRQDPAIKIIGCGSGRLGREGVGLDSIMIHDVAGYIDYISPHYYQTIDKWGNDGVEEYGRYLDQLAAWIASSKNPNMRIYLSEWNLDGIDIRTGLFAGGFLNRLERTSYVEMAAPALYLRHTSAPGWNNAFINFNNTGWFPAPNYVVMKLWSDHYAPNLISFTGDTKSSNIVATKSADGKTVYVKVVNPTAEAIKHAISFDGESKISVKDFQLVNAEVLTDKNSMEQKDKIVLKKALTKLDGKTISFTMPKWSAGVVTISRQK